MEQEQHPFRNIQNEHPLQDLRFRKIWNWWTVGVLGVGAVAVLTALPQLVAPLIEKAQHFLGN